MRDLPYEPSIRLLERTELVGPFEFKSLWDLDHFRLRWGDAEHEFRDTELNELRNKLYGTTTELLGVVVQNTWPIGASGMHRVPSEWSHEQPKRFKQVRAELERLADAVVETHQALVRRGREKLDL